MGSTGKGLGRLSMSLKTRIYAMRGNTLMSNNISNNAVVAIYKSHAEAEMALEEQQHSGLTDEIT